MPATAAHIDAYTAGLGESIADMGNRIAANGGEPVYSAEKAHLAAHDAIRVIARANARTSGPDALERLIDSLRNSYLTERRASLYEE